MSGYTQANRLLLIESPLPVDELLLVSFEGDEHVSNLFEFQLRVLSGNHDIKPEELIGKPVTVTIQNEHKRTFNGFISKFSFGEVSAHNMREYRLTMVPWLWFLTRSEKRRIFQEKNTKDIVTGIFKELGFSDYDFRAKGGKPREYCVQYGESDFEFVSRLLEEEGYAYYFTQEGDKHKMVIVDQANAYHECKETNLTFSRGSTTDTEIIQWRHDYEFRKGIWTINDYNFKEPKKSLLETTNTLSKFANVKKFEHYEYPDMYDFGSGRDLVKARIEAEEVAINTIAGASSCSTFYAGGRFKLEKHEHAQEQGEYILLSVFHSVSDTSYFSGQDEGETEYVNHFNCIPSSVHYRPPRVHRRPVMKGPQSAMVTGPKGENIYIDDIGRIKVQFIWDRDGKRDENSSCFLRVMQSWAGNGWGASFIPRIGHEVIVTFLDGDPDRPIVTGTVYNGDQAIPFKSKTQSGIRTNTTKGADKSSGHFNELRFDDKKGSEHLFVQAEKDYERNVKNNEKMTVGNNRQLDVKKNIKTTATDILIKAKSSIELKVGGSSIKMTPSDITIKSTTINVKGSALTNIKGGLVKIN